MPALEAQQLDCLAKAGPCRIDVAAEKLSHGKVLMGFGVVGIALQGGGVGLQRPGDRALPAAISPRLSQPVASFWRAAGGLFCQCQGGLALALAQQQGAEVQPAPRSSAADPVAGPGPGGSG